MNRLLTALTLLLTLPAAVVLSASGGVLCVSEGGHVAFEIAAADCCDGDAHAAEAASATVVHAPEADCCGPCTDLSFRAPPPMTPRSDQHVATAPVPAWTPVVLPGLRLRPARPVNAAVHPLRGAPLVPPALSALRTVVLTC